MIEPKKVKTIYSEETIAILQDVYIQEKLKKAHKLRVELGFKDKSDIYVGDLALRMYLRSLERRLRKRGGKNGME